MLNFRQQALDEEFHPAATEKYLRLTSTSVYMVLATMLLLAVALVIWAIMGSVTDKVQMGGVVRVTSPYLTAFADYKTLQELNIDHEVRVKPMSFTHNSTEYIPGRIISISRQQASRQEELRKMKLLQFEQDVFPSSGVAYEVQIELNPNSPQELSQGTFYDVQVITKRRSILQYLFEKLKD